MFPIKCEPPPANEPLNGLLVKLQEMFPDDPNVVEVTDTAGGTNQTPPIALIKRGEKYPPSYFSRDMLNEWVQFDFGEHRRIKLEAYTLQSYAQPSGFSHMRSWSIQGANDSNTFYGIDEQYNSKALNSFRGTATINCNSDNFRYIRIYNTEKTFYNNKFLVLEQVEFFGEIVEV